MHPFTQYPQFFQYSHPFHYTQPQMQQFNTYQHQLCINNQLWLNYQRAQQSNIIFEGSNLNSSMIKQENFIKQEQCVLKQSDFKPVQIITNHENSKSVQPSEKKLNNKQNKNKRKGKKSTKRKLYNIGIFFNLILQVIGQLRSIIYICVLQK
ncbi:unnamed protein product [Paramecium sonneborni]|uniref:Transmembrane protein n=1 Tax=Paramecium sonneborni TaxID=65129 RepID=A0A8S1QLE3_9CILI|nr:unnamed protein product [Paramecium sonneborni]